MEMETDLTHMLSPNMEALRKGSMTTRFPTTFRGSPVIRVDLSYLKKAFEELEARIKELEQDGE